LIETLLILGSLFLACILDKLVLYYVFNTQKANNASNTI